MAQVIDYSAGFPGAGNIRAAGYAGAARYIGFPDRRKCATAAELANFRGQGIGMALVYQDGTGDWLGGFGGGQANAQRGRDHANSIGFPGSRPIYMAIDRDIVSAGDFNTVMSYLDGAASVLGRDHTGVYGEHDVVRRALESGRVRYGWQTAAWSGGRHYAGAHLYQRIGTVTVGGIACDINDVLAADWGQHNLEVTEMTWGSDTTQKQIDDMQERIASMHFGKYQPIREGGLGGDLAWLDDKLAATREEILAGVRAQLAPLTDDEAVILAAVRAQTSGQPSAEQMAELAAQLKASLGPAVAAELGRRLSS